MMNKTESDNTQPLDVKKPFLSTNIPIVIGAMVLVLGSGLIGYTVGHRQGLSTSGYDADTEQLAEVVKLQKERLDVQNKIINSSVQERDVAIANVDDLFKKLQQAKADQVQMQGMTSLYRSILKQRGGLSLTVQNLSIKPLPENAYEYQLDLVQVSPNNRSASGQVELHLIRGNEILVVPMENSRFNFDDFERLTGRWTMPKGFTPQYIEVRLTGATPVAKRFNWAKGERVEVPSTVLSEIPQVEPRAQ
ncbi:MULTISPECIES: DUF6776 family protein [unclassified Acinetobacter]|uniref:DUF6776 family protein n=1 Tax=unclassified Acinetobacter TaxID=196816 RepID=UPI0029341954|nr:MULTISPECIES: DUF6776 family protein [unclassified Acinetobacter]WOE33062.1 hypothetical protein QSG84_02655 [Acinetobacter sp. SAAs470]WOE37601.1 hypothetical protein QSG86_11700 [Acinetobacter sp. SAAs474]